MMPSNLRESLWRRKPSAAERAGLRAQPELEAEARLTAALAKISGNVPVASNFTARVMDAIERGRTAGGARPRRALELAFPVPARDRGGGFAWFSPAVSVQRYEANTHRQANWSGRVAMVAGKKAQRPAWMR